MTEYFLNDLLKIKNGRDHKHLEEGEIPVYGSGGLIRYVNKFLYDKESILLPRKGTLNNIQYANKPFWTVDTIYYSEINDEIVDGYYLYNYLKLLDLSNLNSGTGVPSMTFGAYYGIKINLPELSIQKQIAKVLSDIDAKIEVNNKINTELESLAKLIYDYWFVQFDFPDANGKPYKSSGGKMIYNEELKREIPEGWESGIATKIIEFNPTESLPRNEVGSYIDMNALPTNGYMTSKVQKKQFGGGMKFRNHDVLVARITPCLENGKTCLVSLLDNDEVGFGSTEFIVMRGKKKPLPAFISFLSRSEYFRKYAIMNMVGTSGRKRVDAKQLELISIPIPPENLLDRFEEMIQPYFEKMTLNTKENQELASLRDWLLPMLMNGQVRVGEIKEQLGMVAEENIKYG